MSIINKEIDRKTKKEAVWAEGVVQFVKLDKFDSPKSFQYQGKSIISTHSCSFLLKEKGKEGREDDGVWVSLGDIEIKGTTEDLRCKDSDGNWHTIERGVELTVDVTESLGKNGKTYYNAKKSAITIVSTDGVAKKSNTSSGGEGKTQEKKPYTPRDTSGMEVGHAVNGGFELIRSGASLSPVEAAKIVHDATVALKTEEAKNRGVDASNYDLGASVGHAILNACKNNQNKEVDVEGLITEAKNVLDVSAEITSYVKGESKASKEEKKVETKAPAKTKKLPEPPMDFDDDIPFSPLGLQYPNHSMYALYA